MQTRVLVATAAVALAAQAHATDYRAEAEFLAREIIETHPRGHEIAQEPDFVAARDSLIAIAGDTGLPQYAMAVGRMFHAANDGHTAVIPIYSDHPEFTWRYPLRLRRFEDGLYVVAAKGDATALLGARLTHIAGNDIDSILRAFAAAQASGNRAWPTNWTALAMTVPGFLVGLEVAPDAMNAPVRYQGIDSGGAAVSAEILPSAEGREDLVAVTRDNSPLEGRGEGAQNFVAEIADALVLAIGAMEDEEQKSFEAFTLESAAALTSTGADRVIIDLRDNGGGNNLLAEPLRRELVRSRFNRAGGIYVLISPQTFSAAMNFATRLERETFALFVGEPTGGSPNHFGDPKFSQAEQSGLPYIVSTLRWQDMPPFDERPWILPDVPAPPRFEDYLAGRDLALQLALEHRAGEHPVWSMRIAKPWERESQQASWRFFYEAAGTVERTTTTEHR